MSRRPDNTSVLGIDNSRDGNANRSNIPGSGQIEFFSNSIDGSLDAKDQLRRGIGCVEVPGFLNASAQSGIRYLVILRPDIDSEHRITAVVQLKIDWNSAAPGRLANFLLH